MTNDIAIIGQAIRFPGANNIDQFWSNLLAAKESIRFFSERELLERGIRKDQIASTHFIRASGIIEGIDQFDAGFFNYSAGEASLIDPQNRLFLECASEALENSGYSSDQFKGDIGVYAGAYESSYLRKNLAKEMEKHGPEDDEFYSLHASMVDYLSTNTAYRLDLKGPTVSLQTWCTTAATSVYFACLSLNNEECDLALAGGVHLRLPQEGYVRYKGSTESADGHTRFLDQHATGKVPSSGLGVLVLKRLDEALRDNDHIWAVIKSCSMVNDGASVEKMSFYTTSVEGQVRALDKALRKSKIDVSSVRYVEMQGNATLLNDRKEFAAISKIFSQGTPGNHYCAIGSVTSNIGHLGNAGGLAGIVKAMLVLKNKKIPPAINVDAINDKINVADSHFVLNTDTIDYSDSNETARAIVNCYGIGGCYVTLILEEPPVREEKKPAPAAYHLLNFSAKTPEALSASIRNLSSYLEKQHDNKLLADIAFTLAVGRKSFPFRKAFVCHSIGDAVAQFKSAYRIAPIPAAQRNVVLCFGDLRTIDLKEVQRLYCEIDLFRREFDVLASGCVDSVAVDLRILFLTGNIAATKFSLPDYLCLRLCVDLACCNMLRHCNVALKSVIGKGTGEITALAAQEAIPLEHAFKFCYDTGHRLSALLSSAPLQGTSRHLHDRYVRLVQELIMKGIIVTEGDVADAPITNGVASTAKISHKKAVYSASLGRVVSADDLHQASYWQGILQNDTLVSAEAFSEDKNLFLFIDKHDHASVMPVVRDRDSALYFIGPGQGNDVYKDFLRLWSALWENGAPVHWSNFYSGESRHRLPLPTYPFQRSRHWIDASDERPRRGEDLVDPGKAEIGDTIIGQLKKLLGAGSISPHDNFFYIGGNSLIGTIWIQKICAMFGLYELSYIDLVNTPVIGGFIEVIKREYSSLQDQNDFGPRAEPFQLNLIEEFLLRRVNKLLASSGYQVQPDDVLLQPILQLIIPDLNLDIKRKFDLNLFTHEFHAHSSVSSLARYVFNQLAGAHQREENDDENKEFLFNWIPPVKAVDVSDKIKSPVFILSAQRSGSTLLRVILAGHEKLFSPPEIGLMLFNDMQEWQRNYKTDPIVQEGLVYALMNLKGLPADEARSVLHQWCSSAAPIQEVYRFISQALGDRILVDKCPDYAYKAEILQKAEQIFDRPRYIFLTRHPHAVVESFVRNRFDKVYKDIHSNPYRLGEHMWVESNNNISEFLSNVDADRFLTVRFEDLVAQEQQEVQRICDFIGIEYKASLLDLKAGNRMLVGPGDQNLVFRDKIVSSLGTAWKEKQLPYPLKGTTTALARTLGYKDEKTGFPLSVEQKRIWLSLQLSDTSSAYNLPFAFRIKGQLNKAFLLAALQELIDNHSVLRAHLYESEHGEPAQEVAVALDVNLTEVDRAQHKVPVEALLTQLVETQLAVDNPPLFRFFLIKEGEDHHVLLLIFHHIIFDGWSAKIFTRELSQRYGAKISGERMVSESDLSFFDHIQEQRHSGIQPLALQYWRSKLEATRDGKSIPTAPASTKSGMKKHFVLDARRQALLEGCENKKVSLFALTFSAFSIAVANSLNVEEFVVLAPTYNRKDEKYWDTIGFFINILPLRLRVRQGDPFATVLQDVDTQIRDGHNHELPYLEILTDFQQHGNRLFQNRFGQIAFVFHEQYEYGLSLDGLETEIIDVPRTTVKSEMEFHVWTLPDELKGFVYFNRSAFTEDQIDFLIRSFAGTIADNADHRHSGKDKSLGERNEISFDFTFKL